MGRPKPSGACNASQPNKCKAFPVSRRVEFRLYFKCMPGATKSTDYECRSATGTVPCRAGFQDARGFVLSATVQAELPRLGARNW
jgi:hypothetical protein